MSEEIKERPDRATGPREVWECEESGRTFKTYADDNGVLHFLCEGTKCGRGIHIGCEATMPPGRYRIRTLDEKPWPTKTRREKRRVVQYRVDDGERVSYLKESNSYRYKCCHVISDEIRDCEIDEDGKVVRVIPLKEGE